MGDLSTAPVLSVRLNLPYDRPPAALAGNARAHWRAEARAKQETRNTVTVLARQAGLHRYRPGHVEHVTAQLVWAPGDRRKRDSDNLWRFAKVIFDCIARGRPDLVGLDVVPDDNAVETAGDLRSNIFEARRGAEHRSRDAVDARRPHAAPSPGVHQRAPPIDDRAVAAATHDGHL